MEKSEKQLSILIFAIIFVLALSCTKEDQPEFGDVQSGFKTDSVYRADTDGFLMIRTSAIYVSPESIGNVYADITENPSTKVASIYLPDNASFPVRKNYYWKVSLDETDIPNSISISIKWMPFN